MSDPTPTRRGAESDQVARMRDAYITLGFRLARMGGDLDDIYRQMTRSDTTDSTAASLYEWVVVNYGGNAWDRAVHEFDARLP